MSTFQRMLDTVKDGKQAYILRQSIIQEVEAITGRKLIVYAADLTKPSALSSINLMDKVGISDLVEGIEGQPIDVFIQSPGGSAEAAEMIVSILREVSPSVRFIVPHTAKSAATMMVLSGDSVLMDHRSELGPIDPQVQVASNGGISFVPAQTILDGYNKARQIIEQEGPKSIPAFMPLISKYDLHLLEICQNAKELAASLVEEWLEKYMFKTHGDRVEKAKKIAKHLSEHYRFLSHGRPININQAIDLGLVIEDMRKTPKLQQRIWKLYCAIEQYFGNTGAAKMFENSKGVNWSRQIKQQEVVLGLPVNPPPGAPQQPVPVMPGPGKSK